jgi:hypothetical protein
MKPRYKILASPFYKLCYVIIEVFYNNMFYTEYENQQRTMNKLKIIIICHKRNHGPKKIS